MSGGRYVPGRGISPSGAHDEAFRRGPGHDEMQAAVFRFLRTDKQIGRIQLRIGRNDAPVILERRYTGAECKLDVGGRTVGFVDILQRYFGTETYKLHDKEYTDGHQVWFAFEIKPRLDTVGGLIRQCRVLQDRVEACFASGQSGHKATIRVIPVVPHDDPKLPLLREMWEGPIERWNVAHGCPDRVALKSESE